MNEQKGRSFFVYGHEGFGKTYLWQAIFWKIYSKGYIMLAIASSGITLPLLPDKWCIRDLRYQFKLISVLHMKLKKSQMIRWLHHWSIRPQQNHTLLVLPSRNVTGVCNRTSIKSEAVRNIAGRHRGVLDGSKDLPLGRVGSVVRASHEACSTECAGRVCAEGCTGSVSEWSQGSAGRDGGWVSLGEGEGAGSIDIDLLTTGDFNVLLQN